MENSFGTKLRELRQMNEISQTELGNALRMTQRKISYLECGKAEPSLEDIRDICCFFQVSSDYLLSLPENLTYYKKHPTQPKKKKG